MTVMVDIRARCPHTCDTSVTILIRSTSGEKIPAGTLVKVDKIEGVKAFVTAVTEKTTAASV